MNVFVVPSWYPHRCHPSEGRFVRDLALATGELRPDWRLALSLWGQGRGELSPRHVLRSPRCLLESLRDRRPRDEDLRPNVHACHRGAFSATGRLRAWTSRDLLEASRANLRRAMERWGPFHLVHAHVSYPGGWIALQLRREFGLPYVVTEHMAPFPLASYRAPGGGLPPYIREPLEQADAVMAVSGPYADRLASHRLARPEIVPNVVDERLFPLTPRSERSRFVFFTACHMEERKGVRELLRAAAHVRRELPAAEWGRLRFRLAGEGPAANAFRREAERLGLGDSVAWLGHLSQEGVRHELAACDAFALASRDESFGIVFLEAMASGRPSIATACGGPEWILTPETGIVVPVGDEPRLADALLAMVREPNRFDPSAIRASFDRRFHRRVVVDRLESVYRSALAAAGGARRGAEAAATRGAGA